MRIHGARMITNDEMAYVGFVRSQRAMFGEYGEERIRPLKYRERRVGRQLLGVKLAMETAGGESKWMLRPGWEGRLERAGLDPVTCRLRDGEAFKRAWAEAEGVLYEKHLRRVEKQRKKLLGAQPGSKKKVKVNKADLIARWRAERLAEAADNPPD